MKNFFKKTLVILLIFSLLFQTSSSSIYAARITVPKGSTMKEAAKKSREKAQKKHEAKQEKSPETEAREIRQAAAEAREKTREKHEVKPSSPVPPAAVPAAAVPPPPPTTTAAPPSESEEKPAPTEPKTGQKEAEDACVGVGGQTQQKQCQDAYLNDKASGFAAGIVQVVNGQVVNIDWERNWQFIKDTNGGATLATQQSWLDWVGKKYDEMKTNIGYDPCLGSPDPDCQAFVTTCYVNKIDFNQAMKKTGGEALVIDWQAAVKMEQVSQYEKGVFVDFGQAKKAYHQTEIKNKAIDTYLKTNPGISSKHYEPILNLASFGCAEEKYEECLDQQTKFLTTDVLNSIQSSFTANQVAALFAGNQEKQSIDLLEHIIARAQEFGGCQPNDQDCLKANLPKAIAWVQQLEPSVAAVLPETPKESRLPLSSLPTTLQAAPENFPIEYAIEPSGAHVIYFGEKGNEFYVSGVEEGAFIVYSKRLGNNKNPWKIVLTKEEAAAGTISNDTYLNLIDAESEMATEIEKQNRLVAKLQDADKTLSELGKEEAKLVSSRDFTSTGFTSTGYGGIVTSEMFARRNLDANSASYSQTSGLSPMNEEALIDIARNKTKKGGLFGWGGGPINNENETVKLYIPTLQSDVTLTNMDGNHFVKADVGSNTYLIDTSSKGKVSLIAWSPLPAGTNQQTKAIDKTVQIPSDLDRSQESKLIDWVQRISSSGLFGWPGPFGLFKGAITEENSTTTETHTPFSKKPVVFTNKGNNQIEAVIDGKTYIIDTKANNNKGNVSLVAASPVTPAKTETAKPAAEETTTTSLKSPTKTTEQQTPVNYEQLAPSGLSSENVLIDLARRETKTGWGIGPLRIVNPDLKLTRFNIGAGHIYKDGQSYTCNRDDFADLLKAHNVTNPGYDSVELIKKDDSHVIAKINDDTYLIDTQVGSVSKVILPTAPTIPTEKQAPKIPTPEKAAIVPETAISGKGAGSAVPLNIRYQPPSGATTRVPPTSGQTTIAPVAIAPTVKMPTPSIARPTTPLQQPKSIVSMNQVQNIPDNVAPVFNNSRVVINKGSFDNNGNFLPDQAFRGHYQDVAKTSQTTNLTFVLELNNTSEDPPEKVQQMVKTFLENFNKTNNGQSIQRIIIGNENDVRQLLTGETYPPEQYVAQLEAAYKTIKAIDPSIEVFAYGDTGFKESINPTPNYLEKVIASTGSFDGITTHFQQQPSQAILTKEKEYQDILQKYGYSDKGFIVGETSLFATDTLPPQASSYQRPQLGWVENNGNKVFVPTGLVTYQEYANFVTQTAALAAATNTPINLLGDPADPNAPPNVNALPIDTSYFHEGQPTEAYKAAENITQIVSDAQHSDFEVKGNLYKVTLDQPEGSVVTILWNTSPNQSQPIPEELQVPQAKITNAWGEELKDKKTIAPATNAYSNSEVVIITIPAQMIAEPQVENEGNKYIFTTNSDGQASWYLAKGEYQVRVGPVEEVKVSAPDKIELAGQTDLQTLNIAVVKKKQFWLIKLFNKLKELLRIKKAEAATGFGTLIQESDSLQIPQQQLVLPSDKVLLTINLYNDKNKNGQYNAGEELLKLAGVKIVLEKTSIEEKYDLLAGWNLINLPVLPTSVKTASDLLNDVNKNGADVTTIAYYDNGGWHELIRRETGDQFGKDFKLQALTAYFLRNHRQSEWQVSGKPLEKPTWKLKKGWNAIGINNSQLKAEEVIRKINELKCRPEKCALEPKYENADVLARWRSGFWDVFMQKIVDEAKLENYGNSFEINPIQGYFLRLKRPTAISVW